MTSSALTTFPGEANSADVHRALAALNAAATHPVELWDHARSQQVQELAAWLHCAAMCRRQDLAEVASSAEGSSQNVIHGLITAHASMRARQEAEIAPFKGPDGALLGNDYDDHDEYADRHADEKIQMLGMVMAVLTGEFGRPEPQPDAQAGMSAVLEAMTGDLEGGDIVEAIKDRLQALGFDLAIPDAFEDEEDEAA
ncbi:hypothetical protein [Streptomyces sp. RKAG337]|uniref:hypothetical protein n=1 Tax=Streptomyces sp. RKAG337 TaxID=2893404 RepID=UPI0020337CC7|nr:hypothetical protein [Streptomyces sp. RKAG337]MCM2430936.1 hypothetical protein [Streptomyces sp. RKAG337]